MFGSGEVFGATMVFSYYAMNYELYTESGSLYTMEGDARNVWRQRS
jgi:hypothetical protein